jgi:NAD(P)-dependent dehydrogenase (short-subunit alcohol dehydrogenase family)
VAPRRLLTMDDLRSKVAVVTGGASGIGFAMAQRFLAEGMRVVLADVDAEALDSATARLGATTDDVLTVPTDVTQADQADELAGRTLERYGAVHVLCNNAGVNAYGFTSWEAPLATWNWVLGVNLWGVIHGIRSFVPLLIEADEGHVVNTSSMVAFRGDGEDGSVRRQQTRDRGDLRGPVA